MGSTTIIPVSEYLRTSYDPDRDYVDGHVLERNMGERDHADLQSELVFLFRLNKKNWNVYAYAELRVQVNSTRFRIPDVCALAADAPDEQIITHPPLLCIEILSPEDTIQRMREKVKDYLYMGVPQVWIFDPKDRTAIVHTPTGISEQKTGDLTLPGTPVRIPLAEIFSVLD